MNRTIFAAAAIAGTIGTTQVQAQEVPACETAPLPQFDYNLADTAHDYTPRETAGAEIIPILSRELYRDQHHFRVTKQGGLIGISPIFNKTDCNLVSIDRAIYSGAVANAESNGKKTLNISLYPKDNRRDAQCLSLVTSHVKASLDPRDSGIVILQFKAAEGEGMKKERQEIIAADTEEKIRCYTITPMVWDYVRAPQ